MKYLGIFATPDEIEHMKHAASMPMIRIGNRFPESAQDVCHRLALEHGLPEVTGYYGCDLRTGEFVSA